MEIKDAVNNAIAFAKQSLGAERTENTRLEEVESSILDGRDVWLITLSMPAEPSHSLRTALGYDAGREYKIFTVTKDDGEILSMKIRVLATPLM